MNSRQTTDEVYQYFIRSRGVGHTKAAVDAVKESGGILLVSSQRMKDWVVRTHRIDAKQVVTLTGDVPRGKLRGCADQAKPLIVDNDVVMELVSSGERELSAAYNTIRRYESTIRVHEAIGEKLSRDNMVLRIDNTSLRRTNKILKKRTKNTLKRRIHTGISCRRIRNTGRR